MRAFAEHRCLTTTGNPSLVHGSCNNAKSQKAEKVTLLKSKLYFGTVGTEQIELVQ
jgi:hypothetical protein